MQLKKC